MINTLSTKIVLILAAHSHLSPAPDEIEVYIYGMECFLNTAITILILFIWGILTNTLLETCSWIIAFSILRHHVGGLHAPTQFACITSSCLLGISNYLVINLFSYQKFLICILYTIFFAICILFAPGDTSKYKLTQKILKKEKAYSVAIVLIEFVISLFLRNKISVSITYSVIYVCILLLLKKRRAH